MDALIKEMEQIVYSGTKLNINIGLMMLDDDQQEEIHDYFMESETDNIEKALKEFDGLRFRRIAIDANKFKRSSELI
jgi:ATP-dependent DNA helicase RecQ